MAHTSVYTGDMTANTWVLDFSALTMTPPFEAGLLTVWDVIPKAVDGTNSRRFEWMVEENLINTVQLAEALDTTETDIEFVSGACAAAGVRAGTLLRNWTDKTKKELIYVTSVDSLTNCTCIRDYGGHVSGSGGGTTGETHADGSKLEIVSQLNFEGSSVISSDAFGVRDRDMTYNYYTLMDARTMMSGSEMRSIYRGNYSSNWAYQVAGMVDRFQLQQEKTLCLSPMVAKDATHQGSMGGIYWFATQAAQTAASMWDQTAEDFSYAVWDDAVKQMFSVNAQLGSADLVTLVPVAGLQSAAYIHESAQRGEYLSETVRGLYATHLQSTVLPKPIPLIPTVNMPSDSFAILNTKAFRVHFLEGRGLVVYNQPLGHGLDDKVAQRWISEMTLECQRPTENLYFHDNVTFPVG